MYGEGFMAKQDSIQLMTKGSIAKQIIGYAVPIFIGYLFQQLYNTMDALIVGNFLGQNALAAVTGVGSLIFLFVGFFNGFATGASVIIANAIGAQDEERTKKAIYTTATFGIILGLIMTVSGYLLTDQMLRWMGLPIEVFGLSSIYLKNYYLAFGDILGSNLFNISIICFFDIIFIKKFIFNKTNSSSLIYILLLINYIFIYLSLSSVFSISLFNIGIPSIIIIATYMYYLKHVNSCEEKESVKCINKGIIILKFIITSIILVITSILLTFIVNKLSIMYPSVSSSFIGAIFLGITTSMPEVVTFITLIKLNNYSMALLDIIGSNLFNLLIIAIGDLVMLNDKIYNYADRQSFFILILCIVTTFISMLQNKIKLKNKVLYIIPYFLVFILYIVFLIYNM